MAWFATNCDSLKSLDESVFIQAIHDLKSALPKVSKKTPPAERAAAGYKTDFCDARVWLKGGLAAQCSMRKKDGCFCTKHSKEAGEHDGSVRCGIINGPVPTHEYNDESNEICWWADQRAAWEADKPTKAKKTSATAKPRKCSNCGQTGHTKAKCPNAAKADAKPPMSVAEIEQLLANAKIAAAAESVPESTAESVVLEEDIVMSPASTAAAGVGLATEEDNESLDDQDDSAADNIDCTLDDVPYTRDTKGVVYDDDFDEVGKWVDEAIVFDEHACTFEEVPYIRISGSNQVILIDEKDGDRDVVGKWVDDAIEFDKLGAKGHKLEVKERMTSSQEIKYQKNTKTSYNPLKNKKKTKKQKKQKNFLCKLVIS